jgi:hypothetical protein
LDDRSLPSVTLTPEYFRVPTARTRGVLTGMLVSDTPAAQILLQDVANLQVTAVAGKLHRVLTPAAPLRLADVNGDGIPDVIATFRRSSFKGLHAGKVTVTVSDPAHPGVIESTTVTMRGGPLAAY